MKNDVMKNIGNIAEEVVRGVAEKSLDKNRSSGDRAGVLRTQSLAPSPERLAVKAAVVRAVEARVAVKAVEVRAVAGRAVEEEEEAEDADVHDKTCLPTRDKV